MTKTTHGIVRGKTIELVEDLGVAEGQEVEVQVTLVDADGKWGEGLRRSAGALAAEWTAEDDQILESIHHSRKSETRREITE